jgi:ribose-phosphate pyrophosphokinase
MTTYINRQDLPMLLFSTQQYSYLKEKMLQTGLFEEGLIEVKQFPDGERYQRILSEVDNREVVIIGGTVSDNDTLELYDLAYSLVEYGALSLTIVMPYYGYSTMERAVKSQEIVTAKTRARLFSSIPRACYGNKILMLDLHSEGLPHYFGSDIRAVHLYGKSLVMEAARAIGGSDFVLACTDAGRAKWVESLANDMHVDAAFVFKRRLSGEQTEVTSISADVEGRRVIIYDDMIRTGGSLINAAKAYKEAGAVEISVITTHGLFTNEAYSRIKGTGLFRYIYSTDSHPNAKTIKDDSFVLLSVADLFSQALRESYSYHERI